MGCFGPGQTEQQREEHKRQKHNSKEIEKQLKKDKLTFRATHRLLLLGNILNILRCCFVDLTRWLWLGLSIGIYISSFFLLRCWGIGQEYNRKTDANPSCQWLRRAVSRGFPPRVYIALPSCWPVIMAKFGHFSLPNSSVCLPKSHKRLLLSYFSEKKQKVEDIKRNIRDAILVRINSN
jgi:hypothetical protein